jgi:hypothetical protein
MSSPVRQPEQLVRLQRLRGLRGWALALGIVGMVTAMQLAGSGTLGNPETWSSAYVAMAAAGMLQWAALPVAVLSAVLLVLAVVLHVAVRRCRPRPPDVRIEEPKK